MKKIFFSLLCMLMIYPLCAQQYSANDIYDFIGSKCLMYNGYPEQECSIQDLEFQFKRNFLLPVHNPSDATILADSCYIAQPNGNFKEIFSYDNNGNRLSKLTKQWIRSEWINVGLLTYTYDLNNNQLTNLSQSWDGEIWINVTLISFVYDANGNPLSVLVQYWIDGNWVSSWKETHTYDANGNKLTLLRQFWENENWINSDNNIFTYDAGNQMLTYLLQKWENEVWENQLINTYTYDNVGNRLSILNQDWEAGVWVNDYLDTYTYDNNGYVLTYLRQYEEDGTWTNFNSATYTYDASGNMLTALSQIFQDGAWLNESMTSYTYGGDDNMFMQLEQIWQNETWINSIKTEYSFSNGKVFAHTLEWNGNTWLANLTGGSLNIYMEGAYRFYYYGISLELYYSVLTEIGEEVDLAHKPFIVVYPNPVNDAINLQIDASLQLADYHIELFDQTGRKVKSVDISSAFNHTTFSIDVREVPHGLYFLRMRSGDWMDTQKIIISKH